MRGSQSSQPLPHQDHRHQQQLALVPTANWAEAQQAAAKLIVGWAPRRGLKAATMAQNQMSDADKRLAGMLRVG